MESTGVEAGSYWLYTTRTRLTTMRRKGGGVGKMAAAPSSSLEGNNKPLPIFPPTDEK